MRLRLALGLAAVVAIAAGAVTAALVVRSNDKEDFSQLQQQEAVRSARQAETVAGLSIGQLANAAALYRVEPDLDQHAFQVLGRTLIRESALHAAAFATAEHECCLVTQLASEGNAPASRGFDLDSDPLHRAAIERARDSGTAAVTAVAPILIVEGEGLVVYLPVYRDGAPVRTRSERRAALIGFAAGAFRGTDLAAAAIAALTEDIEAQLLENGEPVIGSKEKLEDAASSPVRVADRTWMLVIRDPDRPGVGVPLLIAVFGIVMAALLGALIAIGNSNKRMRELQRQAHHDPLTGLKNRRRFEEDLHVELARSRRERTNGALLMLDLDNFKNVNDTMGHPVGDRVIEGIAEVLRGRMRETDILARLGGDEFAIVLPRCSPQEAEAVASAIANAIRQHDSQSDGVPPITASIGIAMFGAGTAANSESVMSDADAAMYRAKDSGRDAVRLADAGESVAQAQDPTG
jgi:diguanylate cyclase (GGDEF)-like protein